MLEDIVTRMHQMLKRILKIGQEKKTQKENGLNTKDMGSIFQTQNYKLIENYNIYEDQYKLNDDFSFSSITTEEEMRDAWTNNDRFLFDTRIDDKARISTVFLILDHGDRFWTQPTNPYRPSLFETMSFTIDNSGGQRQSRYHTYEDSIIGHLEIIAEELNDLNMNKREVWITKAVKKTMTERLPCIIIKNKAYLFLQKSHRTVEVIDENETDICIQFTDVPIKDYFLITSKEAGLA